MAGQVVHRVWRVVACVAAAVALLLSASCEQQKAAEPDAQAIVIGAGLSGLSAAVEMGRSGLKVLVVDMNSVAGGHTMLAGGVAMAATPLQERLGIEDSAKLAYADWMDWSKDGDAEWTRFYASNSRQMVYDWVTAMGVDFVRVAPSHGNSVPRFHFTRGRAAHLVLPIYRTALSMPNISFQWNALAEELLVEGERVTGVVVKDLRSGEVRRLTADNVVLATGGFESDVERVLANWIPDLPRPDRLLIGSAISATGSGHDMATGAKEDGAWHHSVGGTSNPTSAPNGFDGLINPGINLLVKLAKGSIYQNIVTNIFTYNDAIYAGTGIHIRTKYGRHRKTFNRRPSLEIL